MGLGVHGRRRFLSRAGALLFSAALVAPLLPVAPAVMAASPAPTAPPTANPPTGTLSDGSYVVPAGAVPIHLKSGAGVASGPQGASGRVDVVSRSVAAAKAPASKKTELVALRNEHSRTFALPDGTYSLEASPGRMNYQDAAGAWQPVDLSLKPTGDPAFGLKVAALDRAVAFGTSTGTAGVARVSTSKGSVSLSASSLGPASVNASDVAFAATAKGDPSVTVTPTDTGFEFAGSWPDAATSPALELTLDPGTLLPSLDADGRTVLLSSVDPATAADGTTPVGLISAPVILEGGPDGGPAQGQSIVSVSLTPGTGTTWTLRYALDPTWLADPARVFPVVLDPSVCLGEGASGCTYNGTGVNADHFVESGLPSSYPTGWTVIRVGYDIRGWGYQKERALLYFESVGLSALPDGATIYDTDLKLHISSEYGSPTSETITAYRITDPWSLSTTWNQFGSGGNGYTSTSSVATAVTASGYMHWDPDAIVQSWYAHRAQGWTQNLGFALKMSSETSAKGDVEFDRYNDGTAAYRPLLTINYEIPQAELSFDPALGSSYAPTTMLAGVPTTLPVRVRNTSGFTFTAYASNANSYYDLAYRFFDQQGNVPAGGSGRTHLPASLANGATSATIPLAITPPTTPGPYSLRLDLGRYNYGTLAYASDYADPAKFYARAKTSAASDNTRWTGSSVIERDEFSVRAVATTPQGGEWKSVELGDGGTLAINLWSRDLEYTGAGGVGFSDLLPLELAYGYRDSAAGDATGILGANGWWTNFDERLVGGSGAGDFTYQDPQGNRIPVNTNQDAQLLGAGIVLSRPRVTIWDDNGQAPSGITLGDPTSAAFASPTFAAFSGQFVLKAALDANHGITPTGFKAIDLNQYPMARFAVRTTTAASAGVAFKIHNVTNGSQYADRWFVYTVGTTFTSGFSQYALGGSIANAWSYYADDSLLARVIADGNFGSSTDDFQIIALDTIAKSGSTGSIYLDSLRLEGRQTGGFTDSVPPWTSNGTGVVSNSDTPDGSAFSVQVPSAALASSPDCSGSPCFSNKNLLEFPYASWAWRKVGGGSAAIVYHLKNARTAATADITYYAGPAAPVGASHPIQVADALPEGWVHVTRNVLEDARATLNWFNTSARETHSSSTAKTSASTRAMYALVGATTGSPLGPDDVTATGYRLSGVDGQFLLVDNFVLTTLPELGSPSYGHPSSAGDATFAYDFSASYPSGEIHYFNAAGLLVRLSDRNDLPGGPNEHTITLDWQVTPNVAGQSAFALTAIHAPSDGAGFTRRLDMTRPTGSVVFTEVLGTSGSSFTARSTAFTVAGGDVTRIKPARQPSCGTRTAGGPGSGCVDLTYDAAHHLTYVADPRWDGTSGATDFRWHVTYLAGTTDPEAIRDASKGDAPLLRVLNYAVAGSVAPASARVLWQDAAAARLNSAIYADLTAEGRLLREYATLACQTSDCVANPPLQTNLANQIRTAHEFDGLARVSTEVSYRCPADAAVIDGCTGTTAQRVVTRQATQAAAAVDNYSDPLTASEFAWSQTPDEYAASLRDSGGGNPDLYRTSYTYDEYGRATVVSSPAFNARPDYAATVKSTTQSASALTAYWRLGEASGNAADSTGHGYTGTVTTGVTRGTGGALVNDANAAMSFNGTTGRITSAAPIGSSAYTLEAWVNVAQAGLTGDGIVGDWASSTGVLLYLNGSSAFGLVHNATYVQSSFVPVPGRWYHVAATWNGSLAKVYVDGALVAQGTASGAPGAGASSLEIGSYGNGSSTTFLKGSLDEVAVYAQALTPSQVANHFLAGRSIALSAAETAYDRSWRPTQVDDQYLASGGFESGFTDWDFGQGTGGSVCTSASGACAIHSGLAAFSTGIGGNAQQDVALVPGQTFRFQVYTQRTSGSINGITSVYYWKRSSGAWTTLTSSYANSAGAWAPYAWDFTLPYDTDGRVRVALWASGGTGSDTVYFDDAALLTSWANATYNANGTPDRNQILRPGVAGGQAGAIVPTIDLRRSYAPDTSTVGFTAHPAIWPTTATANYVDGSYDPTKPDEDVSSAATYDAWGRTLVATDPDGVATTTTYPTTDPAANGYLSDVASTSNGLNEATTFGYDRVGNGTSVITPAPLSHTTTTTYDLAGHALRFTTPDGKVALATYDAYGFRTADIANRVDGTPSASGLDDLVTQYTYDRFGNESQVDRDCASETGSCAGSGFIDARTRTTHDLLGNEIAVTSYPGSAGGGTARTTTAYFETTAGPGGTTVVRGTSSATRASIYPTGAPAPACPDATLATAYCTSAAVMPGASGLSVSGLDLEGQTVGLTDTYGTVTRTLRDIAGHVVFSIANFGDGVYDPAAPDVDLVTASVYDLAGQTIRAVDVLGRASVTARDALERATALTTRDTAGADVAATKTVFTAGGRVDRTSLADAVGLADASRSWTKTVYDLAGRATKTLAHVDPTGAAGFALDTFEGPSLTDRTIAGDGIAEHWTTNESPVFITAGAAATENHTAADAVRGTGTLDVAPAGASQGVEWKLDGSFKAGRTYRATAWVKVAAGTTVRLRIGTASDPASPATGDIVGNGTWQRLASAISWTPTADRTGAVLAVYVTSGTASFRLDDAVVWDAATPDLNVPTSETVYDAEGAITASVTPPGVPGSDEPLVTTTTRDVLGRPTQVTVNAIAGAGIAAPDTNLATATAYDDLGRTLSTTSAKGIVTRSGYDRLGNLTSTIDNHQDGIAAGVATDEDVTSTFAVDALGELAGYCPAAQAYAGGCDPAASGNAQAWHYGYDDAGHLAVQTPPVNVTATALASTRWEYDAGGRLARSCDTSAPATSCTAGGASVVRTVAQTYDAVGRTTRQDTYAGAQVTLVLRTDTSYLGDGQPAQTKYSEGSGPTLKDTLDFGYDAAGRPTTVSRSGTTLSAQTWNPSGTLASRTDGDAGAVGTSTFAYDWARRLTSVTEPAGFAATAGFAWRADGLIASRSWTAGGSQATFAYDAAKRPTGITKGSLTENQAYDRAGNVTAESRSLAGVSGDAGSGTQNFHYDALDRVTSTDGLSASANRSFTYDRDGNRRSKTEGTTTFSYEVDRTDELIAVTKGILTRQTFAYDARGNLTTDVEDGLNTVAYAYDLGNKLTAIDGPGTANDAAFTFDALGRFRTRVVGGSATDTYSYTGTTETVSRIANSVAGTTDSIVSPTGDRLGVKVGTAVNWFLPDLHGDIAASLDAAQTTVTNAIRYDAYGETLVTASASGAPAPVGEKAWKFQGRLDVSPDGLATPLYDMSARFYTPGLGAFTQLDTVMGSAQDPLSMNRFLYAQANPWTLTDPTGHCATSNASGGFDLFGSIGNCVAAGAGFVWGTGESVVGVGADLAGAAWSVPGHVADVGRCGADEGCRRQTIHDTLMTGAQIAGEIHARGQAVLADPEAAVKRTISKASFAAAGWIGEEHRKLTTTGGFEGGREAGHIFGTVEAVGLTTVAGGEFVGAGRGALTTARGALSETSGTLRSALSGASGTMRGALAQAEDRIITPRLQRLTTRAAFDVDQAISTGDFDSLIRLRNFGAGRATGAIAGNQAFRGTAVGLRTEELVRKSPVLNLLLTKTREFQYGPDFVSRLTRNAWDVTKPHLVDRHIRRYVTNPPPGRPSWPVLKGLTYL